jgi:predicted Kef-type K+ transport protein
MDLISLFFAFMFGLVVRLWGFPPMLGFLIAGFALRALGFEHNDFIDQIAQLGILLLLFSIGLKLNLRTLFKWEVAGTALLHMLVSILLISLGLQVLLLAGGRHVIEIDFQSLIILAFALSFSSTVFAVKIFGEKGGINSLHGRISIGILIVQDVLAVVFLTFSQQQWPSPWVLGLLLLPLLRPFLVWVLEKSGHGELLILFGIFMAFSFSQIFNIVGLKADLGALVAGLLISNSRKSDELANNLLSVKDFFLIAFFLSIGLTQDLTLDALWLGVGLLVLLTFKSVLYFFLMTRFRLRARTSFQASLVLFNYSEFALIIGAMSVKAGLIDAEWLVVMAVAVSLSFMVATPMNIRLFYASFERWLHPFERPIRLQDDLPIDTGDARILIFGMGRVGTGAYNYMRERFSEKVLGLDEDYQMVEHHRKMGREVILGDVLDSDFWEKLKAGQVDLVMLALNNHAANRFAVMQLRESNYQGLIAATAHHPDEMAELRKLGVDAVFNIYGEAGVGFAEHVCEKLQLRAA